MYKRLIGFTLLSVVICHALPAVAQDESNCSLWEADVFESCFYAGAGLGFSHLEPEGDYFKFSHKNDLSWLVYGGYHFTPEWFAEIAYADLGEVNVKHRNPAIGTKGAINYAVPNIMAGYYLPKIDVMEDVPVDVFVKAGLSAIQNSVSPGNISYEKNTNVQLALGVGLEWRFADHWKLRNAYETYDQDAFFINVSVAYVFGEAKLKADKKVAIVVPAAAKPVTPAPPVSATEPDPVIIEIVPLPAASKASCSVFEGSLEGVVFKVNSNELTQSSQEVLLKTAEVLKKFLDAKVDIQAYTDDQGSAGYNKNLSARRAESVKMFFVRQGIAAERLTATGFGEDKPVATNSNEAGRALNRRVELKTEKMKACE